MNPAPSTKTFAERLRFLLDTARHPSGREYRATEIAEAINAQGYTISRGYISALKAGLKPTPSRTCVQAIAEFFGVPAAYFYDDEVAGFVEEEIRLVSSLRNSPVQHISLYASSLSRESLRLVVETISRLRKLEALPAEDLQHEQFAQRRSKMGRRDGTATSGPYEGETAAPS